MYKKSNQVIIIIKILILFLFLQTQYSIASVNNDCDKINFEKDNPYKIKEFEIEIYKNKKWTENNIRILVSNTRIIPEKFKKRYKGETVIKLLNNTVCIFPSNIRISGDFKNNIILHGNNIKQSLDIHLINNNIKGITKFKLFLDGTKGSSEDEIFLTELLREMNFISPRTFIIDATINGIKSKMLFQEKTEKEMLEYNQRSESPIFEANEKLLMKYIEKFENNNLSNTDIGMLSEMEKVISVLLARQTNNEWSQKSSLHTEISLRALSNLNRTYIKYSNSFKNEFNNFIYSQYNFDNKNLGQEHESNIIKLDIYNLILTITNAWHGLTANNRKFYWNKTESYFEPIYYDGDVNIFANENLSLSLPFSNYIEDAVEKLEDYLNNININNFKQKLSERALNYSNKDIITKLEIIKYNLSKIKESINTFDTEIVNLNKEIAFSQDMLQNFIENRKKVNMNTYFIFSDQNKSFVSCVNLSECNQIELSSLEQNRLLSGNLIKNNFEYIYVGYYPYLKTAFEYNNKFFNYKFNQINFYYSEGIEFNLDKEKKEFNIYQTKPESRAFFFESKLKDLDINFIGFKKFGKLNFLPFDLKGLTGCLTVVNTELEDVNINSQDSNCEDSINFINVKGKVKNIDIKDSYLDALDIDFSQIEIDSINITNAGNDCLDVSFGNYKFNMLKLSKCTDKGISVGEKSTVNIENTQIDNAKIGVASKDSSVTNLNEIYLKNLDTCFAAYNKKQEFAGGIININNFQCSNFITKFKTDSKSEIIIKNNG